MSLAVQTLPTTELLSGVSLVRSSSRARITRPISKWVEDEIVLPSGKHIHERYRHYFHPVSKLWFDILGSSLWSRYAATGPTQNGKTLMCYVAPVLYHLFEIGETTIIGLPSLDMANDKWQQDFLPVIEASAYRNLLPLKGEGSRGGQVKRSITFRNGATLRFMTAGGSDKQVAGYTARVVAITETDGMDQAGESSREADRIEQIEARTRAFGRTGKRVYLECTVSFERGRIWQEIKNGTDSRIARPCPHCKTFVSPEREHLIGWEEAESEEAAARSATWSCPSCGEAWSENERHEAIKRAVIVHKGQEITEEGEVVGSLPETQTFGFRWSAIDNPFTSASDLGAEEWNAKRSADQENAEKKMRQFVWALPYIPPDIDITPLDPMEVRARKTLTLGKGQLPSDCVGIGVGIDTGKRKLHWEAKALRAGGQMAVIDYGEVVTECDRIGMYRGLLKAFRSLRDFIESAWSRKPDQVWIDSGYHEHTDAVYALCEEANGTLPHEHARYRPMKGYGEGQRHMTRYVSPESKAKNADIKYIGKQFHIARVRRNKYALPGVYLVHVNGDHWKSELHQGFTMPVEQPGAITLFDSPSPIEHADYATSITAEKQVEKFIKGRGLVIVWERDSRNNHFLDTGYISTAACNFIQGMIDPARRNRTDPANRPTAAQLAGRK